MTEQKTSLVKIDGKSYLVPFILIASLFFLWGFAHALLDVLNKHFQDILGITKSKSGWIQTALYGGYFVMAIPAGLFMKRFGYRKGIILGLLLYTTGAYMFWPASYIQTFEFTLLCLFVIASGLTFLETAANPYTTVLGPKRSAAQRINLAASFNGLGWIVGPAVGSYLIFGSSNSDGNKFSSMALPYMILGTVVLLVAFVFFKTKLPEISEEVSESHKSENIAKPFWKFPHFRYAVVAQLFYVAAQTGINSFFINYVTETMPGFSNEKAAYLLSIGFVFFWLGRVSGSFLMKWFKPNRLMSVYAIINVFAMMLVIANLGWISLIAIFVTYFCMSVMFPTIFALGIHGLGEQSKPASSYIVMAIVGGAICPVFMGYIADMKGMQMGFIVPLVCFIVVFLFGFRGYKVKY